LLDVAKLLEHIGIEYKETGSDYRVKCWHHDEKIPSMSIHKDGGYFYCFSCQRSGNLFSLLKYHLDLEGVEALKFLSTYESGTEDSVTAEQEKFAELKNRFRSRVEGRQTLRVVVDLPEHEPAVNNYYLENIRGFTPQEIRDWGMGVVQEEPYKGWILIPIYANGILRSYFLRSTMKNRKRYGKFPRKDVLFGIDTACDRESPIYLVEGIFDMIYLRRAGVQAVAALSNRLYREQVEVLKEFRHVVVVPDNDTNNAGLNLVRDTFNYLFNSCDIGVCLIPNGKKDTAECTIEELKQTVYGEINIIDFIVTERYIKWNIETSTRQTSNKLGTI